MRFQNQSRLIWRFTKWVFAKPYLVSLLVGFGIHAMLELNSLIFETIHHIELIAWQIRQNLLSALFQFFIPFFVPFIIASISGRIISESKEANWEGIPDFHSNLILKLDKQGQILYCNQTFLKLLEEHFIEPQKASELLLMAVPKMVNHLNGSEKIFKQKLDYAGISLDLQFRAVEEDDGFLLAGQYKTFNRGELKHD